MVNKGEVMNGLALCAGVGGLELGLRLAMGGDYRTVCYVEREAYCAAVLVARMEDEALDRAPIWDDLSTFEGSFWCDRVGVITAGYPCQPFSTAGGRRGAKDARHLWPEVSRIIGEVDPAYVFLENVEGHITLGLEEVRANLLGMGYRVSAGIFSAAECGAPQLRKRLFVLAHKNCHTLRLQRGGGDVSSGTDAAPPREYCKNVADADRARELQPSRGKRSEWGRPDNEGKSMVHTDSTGLEGRAQPIVKSDDWCSAWPPGPEVGHDEWPAWEPQPAVRRETDGISYRVDRLRALGNAVVPLVAAHAWNTLTNG